MKASIINDSKDGIRLFYLVLEISFTKKEQFREKLLSFTSQRRKIKASTYYGCRRLALEYNTQAISFYPHKTLLDASITSSAF